MTTWDLATKPSSHRELRCVSKRQVRCLALQNWICFLGSQCICFAGYYLVELCLWKTGFPPWFPSQSPFWSHSICKMYALTFTLLWAHATGPVERLLYTLSLCIAVYISLLPWFSALETLSKPDKGTLLQDTLWVEMSPLYLCFINNIFFHCIIIARRRRCQVLPPFHS